MKMKTRLKPGDKVFHFDGRVSCLEEITIKRVRPSDKPYDENPQFDACYYDYTDSTGFTEERMTMRYYLFENESELIEAVKKEIRDLDNRLDDLFRKSPLDDLVESRIKHAWPGSQIHDALTEWAEANNYVKSKVPLDERRYG